MGFKLVVVGGNRNPQVVAEIKYLFGGLVEKGKVVFMGMLRGEGLARVYACGDVFVHCSVTETFGLVVLESMSSTSYFHICQHLPFLLFIVQAL